MNQALFVTGTDTGVGKTLVSTALLYLARRSDRTTAALKPVAAGCELTDQGPRNADALQLLEQCNLPGLAYQDVNPVALRDALAPHVAARREGIELDPDKIAAACKPVLQRGADLTVIEGAGGWRVPLTTAESSMADVARILGAPVVLVVGLRLGCLNHALLSAAAIRADGLSLAGWIGSCIDPGMEALDENISTLRERIAAPCVGILPFLASASAAAAAPHLDPRILNA